MSREIDEKIVQMKFENGQFEKGVQTSIHSLEELKKGLDFKDASKGLENLDKSAKGLKFDGLSAGIEALNNRFTLLGITALNVMNRISNAAINTGERMVASLSVDQINAGWDKYAEKTSAVQTIMSATAKDFTDTGEQMAFVNSQLEKLNWFTDETSFNFLDMVSNIGKFTSNNIPLDQSVTSMQGIATWAAQSGANANEASRAMYNLSQAISSGSLRLQDWMSIENANMGTARFKETIIDTALEMGTLKQVGDKVVTTTKGLEVSVSNFRNVLAEGWINSDVLIGTLDKYGAATNKLNEIVDQTGVTTSVLIGYIDDYTNSTGNLTRASLKLGKSQEDTKKIFTKFGKTAKDVTAVTNKTGISLSNLVKLVDDYNAGTLDLTGTANQLGMSASDLESTLQSFKAPMAEISSIVAGTGVTVDELIKYVNDYSTGTFNLAEVSKELGMTTEETAKMMEKFQTETMQFGLEAFKAAQEAKTFGEAIQSVKDAVSTKWMTTFEYIFGDYEQAKEFWTEIANTLYGIFAASGDARNELLEGWSQLGGRNYVIASIYNLFTALIKVMTQVKKAWRSVFPPQTAETLLALTERIYKFTDSLIISKDTSLALYKNLRTLFLAFDTVRFVVTQAVKAGFNLLQRVLAELDIDISGFTDSLLRASKGLNDYVKNQTWMTDAIDKFGDILVAAIRQIKSFIAAISQFGPVKAVIDAFHATFTSDFKGIGSIITFLGNTFSNFIGLIADTPMPKSLEDIKDFFVEFGKTVSEEFDNAGLDFSAFEKLMTSGWVKVIEAMDLFTSGAKHAKDVAGGAFKSISEMMKEVDWSGVALLATGVTIVYLINKIADAVVAVSNSLLAFTNIGKSAQKVVNAWAKVLESAAGVVDAAKWAVYGAALIELGVAVMFFAGALTILSKIPADDLDHAAFVLGVVAAAIVFFTNSIGALPSTNKASGYLLSFAALMFTLSYAMNSLDVSDPNAVWEKIKFITIFLAEVSLVCLAMTKVDKQIKIGVSSMLGIAASLWLMLKVLNDISKYDQAQLFKAIPLMGVLTGIVIAISKLAGKTTVLEKDQSAIKPSVFWNLMGVVIAMYAMVSVIKKLGNMDPEVMTKGILGLIPVVIAIRSLLTATTRAGIYADKVGVAILGISLALNLLIPALEGLASIPMATLAKGSAVIIAISNLVFKPLIKATNSAGPNAAKAGLMLLSMAGAMAILQLVVKTLGKLELAPLIKGTAAVSILMLSLVPAIEALGTSNYDANKGLTRIIIMAGLVGALVFVLAKFTDTTKALAGAAAMSMILIAMVVPMHIIDTMKNQNFKFPTQMLLMVGIFGALVIALSAFTEDGPKALLAAASLSAIIIAFAAAMKIMDGVTMPTPDKANAMIVLISLLGAIMIGLGAVSAIADPVAVLALTAGFSAILLSLSESIKIMSNTKSKPSLANAKAMSQFVEAIGLVMIGLGVVSAIADPVASLALATGMSEILVALGVSARFLTKSKMPNEDEVAKLITFAGSLGLIVSALSLVADPSSVIQLATAMSEVIMALSSSIWLMSAVKEDKIPLNSMYKMVGFVSIAGVVLTILSNFVNPDTVLPVAAGMSLVMIAMAGVVAILGAVPTPNVMTAVNALGALTVFVGGMGVLLLAIGALVGDANVAQLIQNGGEVLMAIGVAIGQFVGGIIGGFIGGAAAGIMSSFTMVCAELWAGSVFLVQFMNELNSIPGNVLDLIGTVVGVVAAITAAEFLSGLKALPGIGQLLTLGTATLPMDFASFGLALQAFEANLGDVDAARVKNAADAVAALATATSTIPAEGGLFGMLFGTSGLGGFAENLPVLGEGIAGFAEKTKDINSDTIEGAVGAAQILIELEKSLPREGGALQSFFGSQNLGDFADRLSQFGVGILSFSNLVSGRINQDGVDAAHAAGQMLIDLENSLPRQGGILDAFIGRQDLGQFGTNLSTFGSGLVGLSNTCADLDTEVIGRVNIATKRLIDLENSMTKESGGALEFWFGGESNLKTFGDNLAWLGTGLKNLSDKATRTDFSIINQVIEFVKTLGDAGDIGTATEKLASAVVDMCDDIEATLKEENTEIVKQGRSIALNLVLGFIAGLAVNSVKALDAVEGFAKALVLRFEKTLEIESPSRVMMKDGAYIVQGVAEGITGDMSAEEAAEKKAQNIADAFQEVFDNIDVNINLGNVKLESWQLGREGRGANWRQELEHTLETKVNELNETAEKVRASYAKWLAIQQAGVDEKSIKEAEISYIEMSNSYMSLRNEIIDLQIESAESMIEELDLLDEVRQAEYDRWLSSKEGKNASYAEQTGKEMELLVSQLTSLAKTTAVLRSKHQALIDEFGADSKEAREAYVKALQSETKLNETYDSILETQKGAYDTIKEARDAALKEYSEYMNEIAPKLLEMGFTQEEVEKAAVKASKFDKYWGEDLGGGYTKKDIDDAMALADEEVDLVKEELIQDFGEGVVDGVTVAIEAGTPVLKSSGKKAGTALQEGVIEGLGDPEQMGKDYTKGLIKGIVAETPEAKKALEGSASGLNAALKFFLGEESPSKITRQYGVWYMDGLALGIRQNGNSPVKEVEGVSNSLTDGLSLLKENMSTILTNDLDLTPTITPVLNMDDVINGSKKIPGLLNANAGLNVSSIDLRTKKMQADLASDGTLTGVTKEYITNNNFTQNNYSPKALSRYDIYRQTRNQILQLKGVAPK